MSGYKAGYSESHSPFYQAGLEDGLADAPREKKLGPDPEKAHSAMYMRGYSDGLGGG
jgi:hypothetical protein